MALTSTELADLRATADDFLPGTCTIQTKTEGVDALGGATVSWADASTAVYCRLDPLSPGSEIVRNYALEGQSTYMLILKYDQAINLEQRVYFGGVYYEVRAVIDQHSYVTAKRALLVKVD